MAVKRCDMHQLSNVTPWLPCCSLCW
jgi:hypothetical protein